MVGQNNTITLASGEKQEYKYYVCGRSHRSGAVICSSNSVKCEKFEQAVAERLSQVVQQPEIIREIIRKVNSTRKQRSKPLQEELAVLEKQIGTVDSKIEKTFELFYAEAIDVTELKKRKDALEQEKVTQEKRRQEIMLELNADQDVELPEKQILAVIMDFAKVFAQADPDRKKMFLKTLVKDITLTPQRTLDKINLNIEIPRKSPTEKDLSQQDIAVGEVSPLLHISHLAMIRFTVSYQNNLRNHHPYNSSV
jgi:site-specific DNA recombinase